MPELGWWGASEQSTYEVAWPDLQYNHAVATPRRFHPLRYFQWAHTTPTMIYMIYISSDTSVVPVQHVSRGLGMQAQGCTWLYALRAQCTAPLHCHSKQKPC